MMETTESNVVININTDEKCPRCEKKESVNGGMCLDCITDSLFFSKAERELILRNDAIFNDPESDMCECGMRRSIYGGPCLRCVERNMRQGKPVNFKQLPERWPADSKLFMQAKKLISEHHTEANLASVAYIFKAKHTETNGKIKLGSCKKQSPTNKMLHGWDYIIELAWDMWAFFEPFQRDALLLHELCHIRADGSWKIEPHNVEEFSKVIEIYGLWKPDLVRFAEVIKNAEYSCDEHQEALPGM